MGHSTMAAALPYQHATDQRAREIAGRLSEVVERRSTDAEYHVDSTVMTAERWTRKAHCKDSLVRRAFVLWSG